MKRWTGGIALMSVLGALAIGASACGGGASTSSKTSTAVAASAAADTQAVESIVRQSIDGYNAKDPQKFTAAWTQKGLSELFAVAPSEVDALVQSPDFKNQLGDPPLTVGGLKNTSVSGDTGSTELTISGQGALEIDKLTFKRDGGAWKIDGADDYAVSPDVPAGYKTVTMPVQEFAFGLDTSAVAKGNMAFEVQNVGKQDHEAMLLKVGAGVDLGAALQSAVDSGTEELPTGVEMVAQIVIKPGRTINMVLEKPLDAGRYAFVCFLPDTAGDGAPHVTKGMKSEFTLR